MLAVMRLVLAFCCLPRTTVAWGQWRVNQRSHQMSLLSQNSTLRLCRDFTDRKRFSKLLEPVLMPRVAGTVYNFYAGWNIEMFYTELGWNTEWDKFEDNTPHGLKRFRNLIVTYDDKAPRHLVLACHLDSKKLRHQEMLAATDSAVPCTMMKDIAQTLTPYMHKRKAQMIFFDGKEAFDQWSESDSTYGSRHLAAKLESKWYPSTSGNQFELSREIDRIDVLMLLDLLGAANPLISNTIGHGANQLFSQLSTIELELKRLGCLGAVPNIFNPHLSYYTVEDDHIPFLKRGIPILHLITVPFPKVWHTAADDESALDYPTIDHLTSIVRVFVAKYLGIAPA